MQHVKWTRYAAMFVALVAFVALTAARVEANAQPRGAIVVTGTADAHARSVIAATIERVTKDAGWQLIGQPFSQAEVDKIVTCLRADRPWPCLDNNELTRGAQRFVVVEAAVEPTNSIETVIIAKLVTSGERVPSVERDGCTHCTDDDLVRIAKGLASKLLENTAARSGGTIDVRTIPSGASVTIDGRMVGESDRSFPTAPGSHTVIMMLAGYEPETRIIEVGEGETRSIEITFDAEKKRSGGQPRVIAGSLIAVGALALIGGTYASWTADQGLSGPQSKYDYSGIGIGFAVGGAAVAGVGTYLWIRASHKRSAPTLSLLPGGGFAGWSTAF